MNPLMLAARDNRIAVVERLIDMGVNVNEQAKVGRCIASWMLICLCFCSKLSCTLLVYLATKPGLLFSVSRFAIYFEQKECRMYLL